MITINGYDITNDIDTNTFNYIDRADSIYGTGSFIFDSTYFTNNIPPYSILDWQGVKYCCSSEANYHYGNKSWIHNVSVIELTALLSRFLVGNKAFSVTGTNKHDYDKVRILLNLMSTKYKISFRLNRSVDNLFTKEIEYVFGAGTTLFDALNEIARQYNHKVSVVDANDDSITIDFIDLNGDEYSMSNMNIRLLKKIQNSETYCRQLETEAKNVIDRTTTTIVKNLSVKSPNVKLTEDNAVLELPTKAEQVIDFGIADIEYTGIIRILFYESKFPFGTYGLITYQEAIQYYPSLDDLYTNLFSKYYKNKDDFYATIWHCSGALMFPETSGESSQQLSNAIYGNYSLKNKIISKEKWNLLEDNQKPKFAYYTSNSNLIEGLNTYYKTDLWNQFIGQSVESFIKDIAVPSERIYENGFVFSEGVVEDFELFRTRGNVYYQNLFNINWYVEYIPITNPYLVDKKIESPINEESYKPYALSYNNSSNFIDFDKISEAMQFENKSMGREELIIELDITYENNLPKATNKIIHEGINWYVSSCQFTFNSTQKTATLNLVRDFNKLADCIALNSQYNTLRNPDNAIIERSIYLESEIAKTLNKGNCYFEFKFWIDDDKIIRYVPAVLMQKNNIVYAYCEMLDHYSVGKVSKFVADDVYQMVDAEYVDSNNEVSLVNIALVEIENLNSDKAKQLPIYNGSVKDILRFNALAIFKDAREKLTFTIKANNCIIK